MGWGSYNASDWSKLKSSRKIVNTASAEEIFVRRTIDQRFDPRFIQMREARDSQDHPNSTPIIIGLDVTGSMGFLSQKIATESLHETMMKLYSIQPIPDPALMFAAYGDHYDTAPLQVTQFESDIRIAEQLLDLWLEHHGQGQVVPSYLWYFAARHTDLDSIKKRDKKGFLFTIGDPADCRMDTTRMGEAFGEKIDLSVKEILQEAEKKYEIFHIFIGNGRDRGHELSKLLPGRIMLMQHSDLDALPEIIISAMQMAEGKDRKEVIGQWSELCRPVVERVTQDLAVGSKKKGWFF